ncbi:MAG: NAD(P)-dependent oxidoreductase [Deltaproteobacteria bacterium]|nr:NAD(P)-dependent oxidoreductase [Deltaproteobacteria bacterium]
MPPSSHKETGGAARALVTGGTGFVGSHLVERLLDQGWEVDLLVREQAPGADGTPRLRRHVHDGSTTGLIGIMRQARPDVVFHLASRFLAAHQPEDVESLVASNILLGTQLLEAMDRTGTALLVNAGTSWQHYRNAEYDPVCLYAATKQGFEAIVDYYVNACSIRCVTLKLFDTYGPGDPRPKLMNLLQKIAGTGEELAMSPGEQLVDLVYIDDVAEAFLLAAQRLLDDQGEPREEFAVSSGNPVPLKELAGIFAQVAGKSLNITWGGRQYRPREVMQPWDRGRPLPGWTSRVDLREGISRCLENKPAGETGS